ncbi:MAG: hypothetical protein SYC29_02175 [Planctomycetota bacterium]|nr:hypothetical protein [Planctomycetota bacterium]
MLCRSLLLPALAAMLVLCGCAADGGKAGGRLRRDRSLAAARDLARLAEAEASRPPRAVAAAPIPTPPGVEAVVLKRRDPDDAKAGMSLEAALKELAAANAAPEPEQSPPPPPEAGEIDKAIRHYLKGREAAMNGDHLTAAFELEQARELDPSSTAILRELARSYAAQRNTSRAADLFGKILELAPMDSEAVFTLALAAASRGDFRRAATLLAGPRAAGRSFTHDAAADYIVDFTLHVALQRLGYDRASIEAARPIVDEPPPLDVPTYHRARILAMRRQEGEIRRALGDTHCRLGEYAEALAAYKRAAETGEVNPDSLRPRVIYADLRAGRPFAAQRVLFEALQADAPSVSENDVRLCRYVTEHAGDAEAFIEALLDLQNEYPDDAGLARAAAMVLPPPEGLALLRRFVARRPRDLPVVEQVLIWLGQGEPAGAIELAASLLDAAPELAEAYIDRLMRALADPFRAIEGIVDPPVPEYARLRARVLVRLWAQGEAWKCCRRGLERWPDDDGLRRLRIRLAGALDEPALLDAALAEADDLADVWSFLVRAEALRETERFDEALAAAQQALARASETGGEAARVDPLLKLARVEAERAKGMPVNEDRQNILRRAAELADEARALAPMRDEPYELLLEFYGANGPLSDPDRFRATAARLREANPDSRFYARLMIQDDLQQGRSELALTRALKLFEDGRNDFDNLSLAVVAWRQVDRLDEAERWLRGRLDGRPGDPALLEQLVRFLLARERADEARRVLEDRLAEVGDDPAALRLLELVHRFTGEHERLVAMGERRLGNRPPGTRRALEMALIYARAERHEQAADRLRWITDHPQLASLRHFTGAVGLCSSLDALGEGRETLTLTLVETAVAHFEHVPLRLYGLALRALARLGEVNGRFDALALQAATDARGADDLSPQGAVAWQNPAQELIDAGAPAAAGRALRIRLEHAGELEPPAAALLASMILIADAASPNAASRSIDLLIELESRGLLGAVPGLGGVDSLSDALMQAGNLYTLVGDRAGGEILLREAIRLDPANGMAMNNLGYQRLVDGHRDPETIDWIERAGQLVPDDASVLDTVAWLRYKQERFDDEDEAAGAVSLLRRAVELAEEPTAELFDHLGDALWRQGHADDAVEAWNRVVDILDDPQRREQLTRLYLVQQTRVWGLLVRDPQAMYHRDYGVVLERTRQKLRAVERGGDPPVAATFRELTTAD